MIENRKITMFFELLAGIYGAAKMEREWPTEKDIQVRDAMWSEEIIKYSIDDLKSALDNAKIQAQHGEADFLWPNIGLILSGCKRYGNASHRFYIAPPKGQKESEEVVQQKLADMRKGLFPIVSKEGENHGP